MLKKIFLAFLLCFAVSFVDAQPKGYQTETTIENVVVDKVNIYNLQLSGTGHKQNLGNGYQCWSDFYWGVDRSVNRDANGDYTFYVKFLSNSYYWDYVNNKQGPWAMVKVVNLKLYVTDRNTPKRYTSWILFNEEYSPSLLEFKSKNPQPMIWLTWDGHFVPN